MSHHELGASGAHRWIRCPGSVALSRGIVEGGSAFADEGTAAHALAAECLLFDKDPEPGPVEVRGDETVLDYMADKDMCGHIAAYIEFVRSPETVRTVFGLAPSASPVMVHELIEHRVVLSPWLPDVNSILDHAGVWRVGSDHFLIVTDLKYGAGETVSAAGNEQIMIYEGAALAEVGEVTALAGVVFQPRKFGASWEVHTPCQIRAFMSGLVGAAAATQEPEAPVTPGHKQCRWCPVKGRCKARASWLASSLRVEPEDMAPRYPELMDPGEIAALLPFVKAYRDLLNALEAEALRLALSRELPGWKAVETEGNRTWDEARALEVLRDLGLPLDEFHTTKFLSLAQVEKKLGRRTFAEELGHLVTRPTGSPKLARITDPRPEYGANLFED